MSDTPWRKRLWLGHMLSLVVLILAGCGGSDGTGGSTTATGMGQLLLHVTTPDQERAGLTPRAVAAGQTRQTESITLLRVAVSGSGIPTPIVVECPIPGPLTPQCQVTETPEAFIVTIALMVPVGTERLVVVTGLDQTGAAILRGMDTVDLTQPLQTVTVMLAPVQANTPPRADAGPDQTVAVGATVTLLGNGSSDTNGDPLTFAWELLVRPPGSEATLSNPTGINPTFVVDRPGAYMVQLMVNDGQVDSQPDVVTISTVSLPPVANAGPNQLLGSVGQTVQLNGSGSSDPNGDSLTFRWALTTRPAGSQATLTNAILVNPTFVADVLGTYVAQLIVNDGQLDSPPATVTISAGNLPPVATAGLDQAVVVRQTVQLDGSGSSDPNGDPLTFRWALTTRPAGSQATLTNAILVNPTFVADVLGTYVAQLIVNDGQLDSPPATVTISAGNLPPVATAGLDQAVVVRQTVQLDGSSSSDPNGDPLTLQWAFVARPPRSNTTLANATTAQPTFRADLPGTYTVQLIVNDGIAGSAPDTVTITATLPQPGFAYVANENTNSSITRFAIDGTTGELTTPPTNNFLLTDTSNGSSIPSTPQEVSVHPSGRFAYVVTDDSRVFGVDAETGGLISGSPFPVVMGLANALAVDPSGRFAYVVTVDPQLGPGGIQGFMIAPGTGALLNLIPNSTFPTGISPQAIVVDPTARFVYVVNSNSNSVSGFTIVPETGALISIGDPFPTDSLGSSPQAIAIDPTAQFAYVVVTDATETGDAFEGVLGFRIDAVTGALARIPNSSFPAGAAPVAVVTEPSGQFLYVANSGDDTLSGYTINATSGALIPIDGFSVETGGTPRAVAVDPSGRFAYVTYFDVEAAGAIDIYTINATTGALEEPSTFEDDFVNGPVSIAITGF